MRYTRIDIEGDAGLFATITPSWGGGFVEVEIIAPDGERVLRGKIGDHDDLWSLATSVQAALDGEPRERSDIREYYDAIELMANQAVSAIETAHAPPTRCSCPACGRDIEIRSI